MAHNAKRDMWRERVERCLTSDYSNKEWCELNRICPSTLYYWIAKFKKEEPGLISTQNTSEWIEITKEALAHRVAMVPHSKSSQILGSCDTYADENADARHSTTKGMPAIHVRINNVEMSISPGSNESDIAQVFRAASSL